MRRNCQTHSHQSPTDITHGDKAGLATHHIGTLAVADTQETNTALRCNQNTPTYAEGTSTMQLPARQTQTDLITLAEDRRSTTVCGVHNHNY